MKYIWIFSICLMACLPGCTPDNGNYDYTKLNEVAIGNIAPEYSVNRFANLKIDPVLEFSLSEQANCRYVWYLFQNSSEKIDTLGTGRNLDAKISALPGNYALVYKVFDQDMGVYYNRRTDVVVKDVLSEGFLVLGTVEDSLNISMVNTDGVVSRDIYKGFTGRYLGVKPESVWHFIPSNPGNYTGREYVTVVYDGGKAALFDPLNFVKVTDETQMFVIDPGKIKIEGYHPDYSGSDYLVNNGNLHHRRYDLEYNIAVTGNYRLSTVPVGRYNADSRVDLIAFYDEKGQRFMTMDAPDAAGMKEMLVYKVSNPPFQPGNVGLDIRYVFNPGNGWCKGVFIDSDTKELFLLEFQLMINSGITKMKPLGKKAIRSDAGINEAVAMIMSDKDEYQMIFALGGALWYYDVNTEEEKQVVDFNRDGGDFEIVKLMLQGDRLIVGLNDKKADKRGGGIRILEARMTGGSITLTEKADGVFDGLTDRVVDVAYKYMN